MKSPNLGNNADATTLTAYAKSLGLDAREGASLRVGTMSISRKFGALVMVKGRERFCGSKAAVKRAKQEVA